MQTLLNEDMKWCVKRLPASIRKMLIENPETLVLAGGWIRACIAHEPQNDIDLFSRNADEAKLLADKLNESQKQGLAVFKTDNAYSVRLPGISVQFIHRWTFDHPMYVVPSFDFTIARSAIWYGYVGPRTDKDKPQWTSACDERFYCDLSAKRLVYCSPVRNEDAGGSILRVLKFYQRGYRIPLESMGSVLARLMMGVELDKIHGSGPVWEQQVARVLTGLLREVDPNTPVDGTWGDV